MKGQRKEDKSPWYFKLPFSLSLQLTDHYNYALTGMIYLLGFTAITNIQIYAREILILLFYFINFLKFALPILLFLFSLSNLA